MTTLAYIGFGANLGDVASSCQAAAIALARTPGVVFHRSANWYASEPLTLDGKTQPWYLNTVFEIETNLSPSALLTRLKDIELELGRKTTTRWQPRIADLDLLIYGQVVFADENLHVPHPELCHRRFVLQPLADLAADLMHPELSVTIGELYDVCEDNLKLIPWERYRDLSAREAIHKAVG